jgi:Cys-tRNA(Pro)/Cys-tRNA(Cys) deacylase
VAGRGTTATIALERARIPFTLHEYAHDPKAESYGREAGQALGVTPDRVFKTLVAEVDSKLVVGVVPVVVDASAMGFATVFCSAGRRGLEIELAPGDLVRAAGATVARISKV